VIDGLQEVANRLGFGLALAALMVAGVLIMLVPARYRLFGHPGLAMILFILVATGGARLALEVVTHDPTVPVPPIGPRLSSRFPSASST
jgi:ubiquinone biosynthesis protein